MSANELFKAGKLHEALDAQIQTVKTKPADQGARVFLFELCCFTGDLDRAQRQLDAVKFDDMERDATVQAYRLALQAERQRRRLFAEGLAPKFLVDPGAHVQLRLDAVNCLRGQQLAEAVNLLARADEAGPPVRGLLNGQAFDLLRDCDDVFGPILEVFAHGEYFWAPLDQVDTVALNPPQFPRDLLWTPARLEIRNGPAGNVLLPALYPGSHDHADELVKLGRMTDWSSALGRPVQGLGQRMFLCGDNAVSLLEWRQLQMA